MSGSISQFILRRLRLATAVFVVCLALLIPAAAANGFGGLDRSFGFEGVLDLAYEPQAGTSTVALAAATAPTGAIYVLDRTFSCGAGSCSTSRYLIRFGPNGGRDMTYGGDGTAELDSVAEGAMDLVVDRQGRALVATSRACGVEVTRRTRGGALDQSFGSGGTALVEHRCSFVEGVTITVDRRSAPRFILTGVIVSPGEGEGVVMAGALTSRGRPDPKFSGDGFVSTRIAGRGGSTASAGLPGGGQATAGRLSSHTGIYVAKVGSRGRFDRRFTAKARRDLAAFLRETGAVTFGVFGILARRGGGLDLLGSVGTRGVVLRLDRDGGLDRRFGEEGVRWLPWPVSRSVAGPGNRAFAVGYRDGTGTVGGWIGPDGRPIKSFAGGTGAAIPSSIGIGPEIELAMQRGGRPLALNRGFNECRGVCPSNPVLVGFTRWAPR